jgi:hypothetical protein
MIKLQIGRGQEQQSAAGCSAKGEVKIASSWSAVFADVPALMRRVGVVLVLRLVNSSNLPQ